MKVQKDTGKFLSAEDVIDQQLVIIGTEGEETEGKYGTRLQIGLKVNGEEKILTLNPTSKNNLIEAYGDETKKWIDKEARVHIVKTKVGNEFKEVIYLTHPNLDLEGKEINA